MPRAESPTGRVVLPTDDRGPTTLHFHFRQRPAGELRLIHQAAVTTRQFYTAHSIELQMPKTLLADAVVFAQAYNFNLYAGRELVFSNRILYMRLFDISVLGRAGTRTHGDNFGLRLPAGVIRAELRADHLINLPAVDRPKHRPRWTNRANGGAGLIVDVLVRVFPMKPGRSPNARTKR